MRKILLNLAVSLDGFVEDANGAFDWCFTDQDYGMTAFLAGVDAILFGRKSYEVMLKLDPNGFSDKARYVFSNSLEAAADGYELVRGDLAEAVQKIRSQAGKDIWLFGGSLLVQSMMRAKLVDEMLISVHPILLGAGKPLFLETNERVPLKFVEAIPYSSGLVQLRYRIEQAT